MSFHLTVKSRDAATETRLASEIRVAIRDLFEVSVEIASERAASEKGHDTDAQIMFVDSATPELDSVLASINRKGKAIFLIVRDVPMVPGALTDGKVDDVLVHPFRSLEVLSKVRHYQQILMWDEVSQLNASFAELVERLHDDLKLAERMQKAKLPSRFPEVKGFKVASRYLAGMKSGGDHFDVADSKDAGHMSLVLSDSSSYGLSSAVLSVLMRVAMKLSAEELRSSLDTVKKIQDELLVTLGEKDRLSLFYGVLSRKDYRLRYSHLGSSCFFYAPPGGSFKEIPAQGGPISKTNGVVSKGEAELVLEPEGRLALISDGFVEVVGDPAKTCDLLNRFRKGAAIDGLNELVFQVKAKFSEPDDMPAQDCTAVIFDVDSRLIRLA